MHDLIIIGLGPAGISAALTARKRGLDFLLLGSTGEGSKMSLAPEVDNYPGLPAIAGKDLAKALLSSLDAAGITPLEARVQTVYAFGGTFLLATGNDPLEARKVIIATGAEVKKPLPGEREFLGKGVSYCATCDGMLYKGKTVAVIMEDPEMEEVAFIASLARETYLSTRLAADALPHVTRTASYVKEIIGTDKVTAVRYGDGTEQAVDGVFILKSSVSPELLAPGVKVAGGAIVVNREQETSIPGLYAAGDVTGEPFQYAKAVGEGCVAAYFAAKAIAKDSANAKEPRS